MTFPFPIWSGTVPIGPTRVGTETIHNSSVDDASISFSHTTTADTDLLLVCILVEGAEAVISPSFDSNNLTQIHDTGSTGDNSDVRVYIYGEVSPGAKTATILANFVSGTDPAAICCINYTGVDTTSVAAATNSLSEDVNTSATSTGVHASGGSSGNTLFVVGCGQGADMQPASVDNGFAEIWDEQTGSSNTTDFGHIGAELTGGLSSAVTITYGASDENTSVLIELVTA